MAVPGRGGEVKREAGFLRKAFLPGSEVPVLGQSKGWSPRPESVCRDRKTPRPRATPCRQSKLPAYHICDSGSFVLSANEKYRLPKRSRSPGRERISALACFSG